jgi:hypothetical protein
VYTPVSDRARRTAGKFLGRCLLLGCFVFGVLWLTIPVEPVPINVRWTPSLADAERAELEQLFHLADGRFVGDETWSYALPDYRQENIRAIVTHPRVIDTHHIDRSMFQPDDPPPSWLMRAFAAAAMCAVAGALVQSHAASVSVRRFWWGVVGSAFLVIALSLMGGRNVELLFASSPWFPVSVMLLVASTASVERRVELTPRMLALVVAAAPLLLVAILVLVLIATTLARTR